MKYFKVKQDGKNYPDGAGWYCEGFNKKYQKKTWINWAGGWCFQNDDDEILDSVDMSREQFENTYRKELYDYLENNKERVLQISKYATTHPFEMVSEAFVQMQDINHPDTIATTTAKEVWGIFEKYMKKGMK